MVSDVELQMAQAILGELKNSTAAITDTIGQAGTYGFQLMIAGTKFSGIATIISLAIFLIATYLILKAWIPYVKSWEILDDEGKAIFGYAIGSAVIIIVIIIVCICLSDAIMAIVIPEYVVINKLIELAITT